MKTRRRVIKTPAKGRRSSIICVKKSPIVRKNPRRNVRTANKIAKLATYESPLRHLNYNGPTNSSSTSANLPSTSANSPSTSTNSGKNQQMKEEKLEQVKEEKSKIISIDLEPPPKHTMKTEKKEIAEKEVVSKKTTKEDIVDTSLEEPSTSSNSKKRNFSYFNKPNDVQNPKKRKIKKSPLSRINESNESNILADNSVIIVDDSEFKPSNALLNNAIKITSYTESVSNNLHVDHAKSTAFLESDRKPFITEPIENSVPTQRVRNNDDIVLIDCDSSLMEMEAYHEAFVEQGVNTPPNKPNFMDSIIVIDPDEESPVQTRNTTPKPNEDCFVVWSSLPQPCTSSNISEAEPQKPIVQPLINNNLELLKHDKILIDTQADFSQLRLLNNENNKPTRRKFLKSPKAVTKSLKTSKTVDKVKNVTKVATKSTSKPATKTSSKPATKTTATTTLRRKAKNNGELIFLSESKVEDDTTVKKKKSKKGTLREIVIDGSNVAMAYTNNKIFSEKGIKMLIDYFTKKGHTVKVFVPQYRRSRNFPLLEKWYNDGIVVFTPSRKLGTKSFTPYDDRYILEYATACDGIVVSQDQFRDLYAEKPQYRETIENRLLVPTFVGDYVMFPEDPLGRDGPTLAQFLKH